MIDFELTEEQKQMKALTKEFCEKEIPEKLVNELQDKIAAARTVQDVRAFFPYEWLEKLTEVGLRQLLVPAEYGGGGYDRCGHVTQVIVAEQAGYSMGIGARLLTIPWMHLGGMAVGDCRQETKDWFFKEYMENHHMIVGAAVSEPSGTTDIATPYDGPGAQMNVFAEKDGDEWVINGEKMFSSGAPIAELLTVACRTDKKKPISQGSQAFWVRKDSPGLTYTLNKFLANEPAGNAQTHYDNVRVPEIQRIGGPSSRSMISVTPASIATKMNMFADVLGHCQKIYDQMVEYAKQRVQGGKPIIQHANIAAMLGEEALDLEATRHFIYKAAWLYDQWEKNGTPYTSAWSLGAMHLVKKVAWRLCHIAPEIYGGLAGSVDLPVERFARRIFTWQAPGGTSSMEAINFSREYNKHEFNTPRIGEAKS